MTIQNDSAAPAAPSRGPLGLTNKQSIIAVVVMIAVLALGGAGGGALGVASQGSQIDALEQTLSERDRTVSNLKTEVTVAETARDRADRERGTALDEVSAREAEVIQRESAVKAREVAVTTSEQQIAANSFSGGLHVIGRTVQAGTYSSSGGSGCYYAWKSDTGADADIVDNNIVDGPATVTLRNEDVFESSRCGTWTKVG